MLLTILMHLDCCGNAYQMRQTQMLETIETLFLFSTIHFVVVLVVVVVITTAITNNDDLTRSLYLLCACVKATVPKNMNELWISTLDG